MMLRKALVGAMTLVVVACGGGGGNDAGTNGGAAGWTVLVYMMADNNLEPFAVQNVKQMAAVGSGSGLNLVVQVDRAGQYSRDPMLNLPAPSTSTVKRLLVQKGAVQVVGEPGDVDTGDPASLADFISWGVKKYPAQKYALVLWDHGGAWLGGFGQDTSHANHGFTVPALAQGIKSGLQQAGLARLTMVGFDACLMATFEVAEGLKGVADYLLASEETEPGAGWDYQVFGIVQQTPAVDAVTLGKRIADGYKALNANEATLTLSLVDLNQLSGLESALQAVGQLASQVPAQAVSVGRSRSQTLEFGRQQTPDASMNQLDVGDLWSRLGQGVPGWASTQQQVAAGMARAVLYKVAGQAMANATGLTVYFPPDSKVYTNQSSKQPYQALTGVDGWRTFLEAYLGAGTSIGKPAFASHTATVTHPGTDWVITGQLAPGAAASVTSATLYYGFYIPAGAQSVEHLELYGDKPAAVGASTLAGTWDGSVLQLAQGTTSALGYLSLQDLGNGLGRAVIPLAYFTAGSTACTSAQTVIWQLVFDSGSVVSEAYFDYQNDTVGELQPVPGSQFATLYGYLPLANAGAMSLDCTSARFDATRPFDRIDFFTPTAAQLQSIPAALFGYLEIANPAGEGDYALATWSP
jgi:hypothetical protein